ncbi:hypothetical protein TWF694_011230 [Orbilia ellipsospora]|uniref:Uncharacterized protein n=1 Tax=Orbilia ellipsospora TaxID=2528407 RepID=A0AAV9X8S5_9PEZI
MATDRRKIDDYDSDGSYSSYQSSDEPDCYGGGHRFWKDNQGEPPSPIEQLCHYHDCVKRNAIPPVIQQHQKDFPVQIFCDNNYLHPFATFGRESVSAKPYLESFCSGLEHSLGRPLPAGPSSTPRAPPPAHTPNSTFFQHSKDCNHYRPPPVSLSRPASLHCVPPTLDLRSQNSLAMDKLSEKRWVEMYRARFRNEVESYEQREQTNFQFAELSSKDLSNAEESRRDMEEDIDVKYHDLANKLRNMKLANGLPKTPAPKYATPAERHKQTSQEESAEDTPGSGSGYIPCNEFYGAVEQEKPKSSALSPSHTTKVTHSIKPQIPPLATATGPLFSNESLERVFQKAVVDVTSEEAKAGDIRSRVRSAVPRAYVEDGSESEEDTLYTVAKIAPKTVMRESFTPKKKNKTPSQLPRIEKETPSSKLPVYKSLPSALALRTKQHSTYTASPLQLSSGKVAPQRANEYRIGNPPARRRIESSMKPSPSTSDSTSLKVVAPTSSWGIKETDRQQLQATITTTNSGKNVTNSGQTVSRKPQLSLNIPSIPVAKSHENNRLLSSKSVSNIPHKKPQTQVHIKYPVTKPLETLPETEAAKSARIEPTIPTTIGAPSRPRSATFPVTNKNENVGNRTTPSRPPPYIQNSIIPRKGEIWIEDISLEADATLAIANAEQSLEGWDVVDEMEGYEQDERDWEAVKQLDRDIPKC